MCCIPLILLFLFLLFPFVLSIFGGIQGKSQGLVHHQLVMHIIQGVVGHPKLDLKGLVGQNSVQVLSSMAL